MTYKLLGLMTWKAIRFYAHGKAPSRTAAAVGAAAGLAVLGAVAAAATRGERA